LVSRTNSLFLGFAAVDFAAVVFLAFIVIPSLVWKRAA